MSVAARYGAYSILELRSEAELARPRASNERADLVLAFDPGADAAPWHRHTLALARLARRILVVIEANPERPGLRGEGAAGSELAHARAVFKEATAEKPAGRFMIRSRTRVVART